MPSAWLILPTYNEALNLEPMVRAVLPQLASGGAAPTILVVYFGYSAATMRRRLLM